ncbi:MAG: GNAT family N-acetyltransferase [Alteromonas sp.]|nr:GNAT family N-acetyltransferase [Alteromonas sp.]MAY22958.1 GNAT family N-acetyltransferase [Flavobacteriaceae bacterium]|tara:strand:+ start:206 stop:634 length:429 start_codon:yes stop_codon:yes gene_type:complete
MTLKILTSEDLTSSLQTQVTELYKQLSEKVSQIPLETVFQQNNTTIVYAMEGTKLIGMASMGNYRVISGIKGWIEDVVVDETQRGKGIGEQLIRKLLHIAKQRNYTDVFLFTEDFRVPAIHLYKKLGFVFRDSQIYTYKVLK